MDKTKIDWCDSTWNPVTGCNRGCKYCYARGIAERFSPFDFPHLTEDGVFKHLNDLKEPIITECKDGKERICAYPYGFEPTFHRYRLNDYIGKQGRNIFVCSMADLFGEWVPLEWQREVFTSCRKDPQHNYIFLTKNPGMYVVLDKQGELPADSNMWFGTSITTPDDPFVHNGKMKRNLFLSIEPLLADFEVACDGSLKDISWIIIGAETGRRAGKVIPERSWVENIVNQCRVNSVPVFMKSSLTDIWGEPLIQEFPKELKGGRRIKR